MLNPLIRKKIEDRFGSPIRYSKDCDALAASIESSTQQRISTTTLKRMLGFARDIEHPRLFTLDVLARYLGATNWSSLLADTVPREKSAIQTPLLQNEEDIYALQHYLMLASANRQIDQKTVTRLCQQLGHRPEIAPFITELIRIAGETRNLKFLKKLFTLPHVFDPALHPQGDLYYIGQQTGLLLRKYPDLAAELIQIMGGQPAAQHYLVEWFVDEDHLGSYYGQLLDAYHQHRKTAVQDKLFYYAMKYTWCLQEGDILNQLHWFNKMRRLNPGTSLHPIPAGRYAGILLSEEKPPFDWQSDIGKYIQHYCSHQPYENITVFLLYCCRYLFRSQTQTWLNGILHFTEAVLFKRTEKSITHWGLRIENQLKIYAAWHYYTEGNQTKARRLIRETDPHLFETFMYNQIHRDYLSVSSMVLGRNSSGQ